MQHYIPKGPLKEFVDAIFYISGDSMGTGVAFPRMHQVIIINLANNFNVSDIYNSKASITEFSHTVWVNGMHDEPFMLGNNGGTAMYAIGVKLGMLPFFSSIPTSESSGSALDAWHWSDKSIFTLREQLLETDIQSGFRLIEQYLLRIVRNSKFHELEKLKWLGKVIYSHSVAEIGRALGASRKAMRQHALHHFGSSIKNIQGLIRFNQTLSMIAHHSDQTLSSLHEYYDQSHFINDFKARTGITPFQYKKLCQEFPIIKYTPNFLPMTREQFLDRTSK